MLTSLTLTGFQKHLNFEARFSPGLNLIVGPNWSGKSSLQRAILFALFGSSAVPVKASNLVTRGHRSLQVQLGFQLGDDVYVAERGTRGASLSRAGEVVASGQTAVTAMVEALLHTDAKSFLAFSVARQNEAANVLTLGATRMNQHIESVCGVDLVDQVLARLREQRAALSHAASVGQEALEDSRRHVEAEIADLHIQVMAHDAELSEATAQVEQNRQSVQTYQAWLDQARPAQARRLAILARRDAWLLMRDRTPNEPVPSQGVVDRARAEASRIRQANARRANDRTTLARLQGERQHLWNTRPEVPENSEDGGALSEQLGALRARLADLQYEQSRVIRERSSGVCQSCNRPFENGPDLAALDARAEALKQEMVEVLASLEDLSRRTSAAMDADAKRQRRALVDERLRQLDQQIAAHPPIEDDEDGSEADARCARLERAVQNAKRRRDIEQQIEASGNPGEDWEDAIRSTEQALATVSSALHEWSTRQTSAELRKQAAAAQIERSQAQLERLVAQQADARAAQHALQMNQALSKRIGERRGTFMQAAWESLLDSASGLIRHATDGAVQGLRREEDGFLYQEEDDWRPIELASGHQQAVMGVALKLALADAVGSPFAVTLLDEVSAGATEDYSLRLTEAIKQWSGQCVLISHRESDTTLADHVITV